MLAPHGKFLAKTAVELVDDKEAPVSLRIVALQLCFEYLWGKPQDAAPEPPADVWAQMPGGAQPTQEQLVKIAKGELYAEPPALPNGRPHR